MDFQERVKFEDLKVGDLVKNSSNEIFIMLEKISSKDRNYWYAFCIHSHFEFRIGITDSSSSTDRYTIHDWFAHEFRKVENEKKDKRTRY